MHSTQTRTTEKVRPVHTISRKRATEYLSDETEGRFFCAYFTKRDGSIRRMIARRGVRAHQRGGSLPYDPKSHNLIIVWDVEKRDYRSISADRLISFNIHGATYVVK